MPVERADLKPADVAALRGAVSEKRFRVYLVAASADAEHASRLYLWDRDVAAAILRDVAIVEIALRNALSSRLVASIGQRWFTSTALVIDHRLDGALRQATDALARSHKPVTSDRMVAELPLGFWVNVLNARGSERLWRGGLSRAFPGGRTEAAALNARYHRSWVVSQLQIMRYLRNRCAHHEPLIHGVPLPGQATRIAVSDGIAAYLRLTRMIDRDLAAWMTTDTLASAVFAARPQPRTSSMTKVHE
jgi:hypothetical protein